MGVYIHNNYLTCLSLGLIVVDCILLHRYDDMITHMLLHAHVCVTVAT